MMRLRKWLAVGATAIGLAMAAAPSTAQTLRMVSHADIKMLDPIWTTALITRNHGYMIYDVLFAKDADLKIQPQMAEKYTVSDDKLTWTITLRDGLEWSDGTPVTAEDCIASIKRWGARDGFGQILLKATSDMKAIDAKTFAIILKEPFGLVLEALGKPSSNVPFMMPKRVADTDPNKQIDDYTGSGPFMLEEGRMEAGREDRLREEPALQAAQRAALDAGRRQGRQGRSRRMAGHRRSRRPPRTRCWPARST